MLSRAMRGSEGRSNGHRDQDQVVMNEIQNAPPSCDSKPSNEPSSFCFEFENRSPAESQSNSASSLGEGTPSLSHGKQGVKPSPMQWFIPIFFGWENEWTEKRWIEFTGKKNTPQPDNSHTNEEKPTGYLIPIPFDRYSGMEKAIKEESYKRATITDSSQAGGASERTRQMTRSAPRKLRKYAGVPKSTILGLAVPCIKVHVVIRVDGKQTSERPIKTTTNTQKT
ncbi:uncharacterized protein MELLADRAFT_101785 [Melampsora larici-populina 98AG31]|uniref:Uncharacterized protein n=1 Tax=Melampsora larici-populina (strain 98AG31 / pathotype 3-4-7) TaxID=747676 RepID=F4R6Z0_MELLP|nr:uncharacterized protein MELLADRAFT_101785 [Melampsora larici-populina 98AG31]EGG12370.1 hypothetical protein MELLADRAFT_101785 [Melampsora larici-populina 98AG31]